MKDPTMPRATLRVVGSGDIPLPRTEEQRLLAAFAEVQRDTAERIRVWLCEFGEVQQTWTCE
jgi:hypothetical protein